MAKYDNEKYNNLTVKEYISIKLDLISKAKKNPNNNIFGNIQVLLTIEKMFVGDLAELLRHEIKEIEK